MSKFTVRSTAELASLAARRRFLGNTYLPISLDIPDLPVEQLAEWERVLTSAYNECGCNLGAACLFVSLVLFIARCMIARHSSFLGFGVFALCGLAASVAASLVGKLAGIGLGRRRFRRAVTRLRRLLADRSYVLSPPTAGALQALEP